MSTTYVTDLDGTPIQGATFEAGDVQISINGSVFVNTTNLPTTRRADSATIDLSFLTAAENVDGAEVKFLDQTSPAQWLGPTLVIEEKEMVGIEDGGITAASFATDAITADTLANDAIGASEIAAGASAEIADKIAADWVAGDASPLAIASAVSLRLAADHGGGSWAEPDLDEVIDEVNGLLLDIPAALAGSFENVLSGIQGVSEAAAAAGLTAEQRQLVAEAVRAALEREDGILTSIPRIGSGNYRRQHVNGKFLVERLLPPE